VKKCFYFAYYKNKAEKYLFWCYNKIMDYLKEDNILPSGLSDEKLVALSLENPDNFAYLIERYRLKLSIYIKRLTNISDDDLDFKRFFHMFLV